MNGLSLRLALAALALAALVGLGFYVVHLRREAASARLEAAAAHQEADLAGATVKTVDRVVTRTQIIHDKEGAAVDVVRALPTAQTPLDPDFVAGLRGELDRMRLGSGAPDDHPAGQPADALPVSGS